MTTAHLNYAGCRDEKSTCALETSKSLVSDARQLGWLVRRQDQDLSMRLVVLGGGPISRAAYMHAKRRHYGDLQFVFCRVAKCCRIRHHSNSARAVSPNGAKHFRSIIAAGWAADWLEKNVTSETVPDFDARKVLVRCRPVSVGGGDAESEAGMGGMCRAAVGPDSLAKQCYRGQSGLNRL